MGRRYDTISFLSDFGTTDEFVGVVKSVIRDIAAHAVVIDLTHGIGPGDIRAGSLALARSISYVPSGIVLASVDLGIGSVRRCVAIEVADGDGVVVGPDNGVLAPAVAMAGGAGRAVVLDNAEFHLAAPGAPFSGRDILGPVAGHLCNGVDLMELGAEIDPVLLLPATVPLPRDEADAIVAEVLWVDRFGNVQLNVGPEEIARLGEHIRVSVGELHGTPMSRAARRVDTFDKLGSGAIALIIDSYGMISMCVEGRSASEELRVGASDQVVLEAIHDDNPGGNDETDDAAGVTQPVSITSPVNLRISR